MKLFKVNKTQAGHVARMVDVKNAYEVLVRKPEEKRPGRAPRRK
jgi:hypothetical protein